MAGTGSLSWCVMIRAVGHGCSQASQCAVAIDLTVVISTVYFKCFAEYKDKSLL